MAQNVLSLVIAWFSEAFRMAEKVPEAGIISLIHMLYPFSKNGPGK
jgi:hypothetical protein